MPTAEQVRAKRINELYQEFKDKDISLIDPIMRRALEKYPFLKDVTAKDYATAVLRIIQSRKKAPSKPPPRTS